eukprot:gene13638-15064_t
MASNQEKNLSTPRQATLANFGFTKSVKTSRGNIYQVELNKFASEKSNTVYCPHCAPGSKSCGGFTSIQYLNHHITYKHPTCDLVPKQKDNDASQTNDITDKMNTNMELNASFTQQASIPSCEQENEAAMTIEAPRRTERAVRRKSYTLHFKLKVIDELQNFVKSKNFSDKYKYIAEKLEYPNQCASTGRTRRILRKFRLRKYSLAESRIVSDIKQQRTKGFKVSGRWIKIKMKQAIREFYGNEMAEHFKASKNWLYRFTQRNELSLRRKTNSKKLSGNDKLPIIQNFHRQLRQDIKSKRHRDGFVDFHAKWGRWMPSRRYNVDQVPCPFIINQNQTYDEKGKAGIWISQPGNGLDKRQCTLQLCICPDDPQVVPPSIIFRGKGNVPKKEKDAYDKRVHIYWQPSAWMDSNVALKWVKNTFAPAVCKKSENVLFLDNLSCQMTQQFHSACKQFASTLVYPLPPGETDKCQPVDQGEGYMIKQLIGQELDKYLEEDDNLEKWQTSLTAGERRILLTKWVGEAWEKLNTNLSYRKKLFQKTGLLMTADGSDDELIRPEGFPNYTF